MGPTSAWRSQENSTRGAGPEGDPAAQARGAGDVDAGIGLRLVGGRGRRQVAGGLAQALRLLGDLRQADRPHRLGGAARIGEAGGEVRPREDGGPRLDQHAVLHARPVEHDDVVLDHHVRADGAGMHHGVAAHRHPVADRVG